MDQSPRTNPNALLQRAPLELAQDLESLLTGSASLSESDCHALAEGAGFRAMTELQAGREKEGKAWIEIAVRIYDALSTRASASGAGVSRKSGKYQDSASLLRSDWIGRYGEIHGDLISDPQRLKVWFMDRLDLDIGLAKEMASKWTTLNPSDIQRLRGIKNRLKTLKSAMSNSTLGSDPDLSAWKDLERSLP